ncbi:hypothetical protein Pyn_05892 [Prunus yedoensis var. nudiflora]|uniref:Uncharacterized protein n=1 Tax=Prunus yedoensis var. nudiflora TaxID=2094558 RepID=A0A314Y845_PRUYE|nr:hypothetical protein Pyn_05892 [Prunus yedoensis var. nudiflora]
MEHPSAQSRVSDRFSCRREREGVAGFKRLNLRERESKWQRRVFGSLIGRSPVLRRKLIGDETIII